MPAFLHPWGKSCLDKIKAWVHSVQLYQQPRVRSPLQNSDRCVLENCDPARHLAEAVNATHPVLLESQLDSVPELALHMQDVFGPDIGRWRAMVLDEVHEAGFADQSCCLPVLCLAV